MLTKIRFHPRDRLWFLADANLEKLIIKREIFQVSLGDKSWEQQTDQQLLPYQKKWLVSAS
jgi:hypothetical protein